MTGLEAFEKLKHNFSTYTFEQQLDNEELLRIIKKSLIAFEFIKERELLEVFKKDNGFTYLRFKGDCYIYEFELRQQIPQEKYELLKEVL